MKKSWFTWLGLGAACAVCCAPLIAPLLAGMAGAGAAGVGFSLFGLSWAEALCLSALAAALAAFSVFVLVRRRAARKTADACACAPSGDGAQCDAGGACSPAERGASAPCQ